MVGDPAAKSGIAAASRAKNHERKQALTVATNLPRVIDGHVPNAAYNGYGLCPLTIERGKIVLAELSYNGRLLPTFLK